VQLPGLTRKNGERRPQPPGQHGHASGRRKKSAYRKQLEEKQKIRFNYGVTEAQLRRYLQAALRQPGVTGDALLAYLERRLDNVVFRLGLAPTIPAARQLVVHGHVRVNGKKVDRPSYLAKPGDTVTVSPRTRENAAVVDSMNRGPQVRLPQYLAKDPSDDFTGRVIASPVRADVPFVVDVASVVEFYAR
jgi:small subunit ribosomal protein S4